MVNVMNGQNTTIRQARALQARRRLAPAAAGLTVLEMMIALALIGMLLAAVAVAMQAVSLGYAENRKIAEVTQTARVVLHRMMKEVRTAEAVASSAASVSIIPPDNAEGIEMLEYELLDGTLYYHRSVNGVESSVALIAADGDVQVTRFEISRQTAVDDDQVEYTQTLTVRLGLKVGANAFEVTSSVCPRRNISF